MKLFTSLFLFYALSSNVAHAKEWPFKVYLDGKEIGQHTFVLNEKDGEKELTSTAKFKVKVLFINAYNYDHVAKEKWRGDCMVSLESKTEENSENTVVKGKLENAAFIVDIPVAKKPKARQTLPECIMTFPYWNAKMLGQSKLLNPQTGEWLDVKINSVGNETIEVRGQNMQAEHFRLEATKMKIDLWYSPEREWLALKSTTPEGYVITYKLQ
ncbi:MAG TPA: DUF6134 family protein [Methylophilaceae bacterium]|nr:DUF6134 family protein [Methylophilaceae bacterium]